MKDFKGFRAKRTKRPRAALLDSKAMHDEYPDTWDYPDDTDLARIGPGWAVKVCVISPQGGERFWLCVTARDGDRLRGVVANALVSAIGVDLGDEMGFELRHILEVDRPAEWEQWGPREP